MSFTEKIDVLDLIIQILNEHEKKLSHIVDRLENIANQAEPASNPATMLEEDSSALGAAVESSKYLEEHR
jgi:hypothetical protein